MTGSELEEAIARLIEEANVQTEEAKADYETGVLRAEYGAAERRMYRSCALEQEIAELRAAYDTRILRIQKDLDEAEAENSRARQLQSEYEEKLSSVDQTAAQILADAKERADRAYEGRIAQAELDADMLTAEARAKIRSEREAMLRSAKQEVAALALLAASKVAQRSMDDDDDRALVDSFLAEVGEMK